MLEFLPDKVFIPEPFDFKEIVAELYEVFERDIKLGNLKYKGIRVIYDDRKIDSQYEEGFWHVIERGKNIRTLDLKRAKRLPWVKPLITFSDDPRLLKWTENSIDGKGRLEEVTYIYYEEESYLVILKDKRRGFYLATAYYVVGYNRQWYREKYEKAQKKGPGC
ncbi:MAG TPA: hypothetical protein DCG32_06130 [Sphaerochaeta sp.]|jgi:hypothetical protein|nr:hypothetical protein [Sphaerochaeta sp.]